MNASTPPGPKLQAVAAGLLALVFQGGLWAQSPPPDSLDDGPHVYWLSTSRAVTFSFCGEDYDPQGYLVRGSLSFEGGCGPYSGQFEMSAAAPPVEEDTFEGVSRIFAVSDVHGEFEALASLLRNAGVVDEKLGWSWGDGHLVILGDILDRGDRVTECLWLVHRLEREARTAGGRVHYLLGNHEAMVLQGDLRYVNEKYMDGIVRASGIDYDDLFGPAMELGRWLRTKHMALRLNGILFVHAGMGTGVLERGLGLSDINGEARKGIDLRSYDFAFNDMPGFLFGGEGPLWYRGYWVELGYPRATADEVQKVLDHFGASAVVVGHTDIGEIQAIHGARVIGIDVDLEALGAFQGLLWEGGTFYKVLGNGARAPLLGPGATPP